MAKRPSHFQPLVVRRRMCSFYLCLSLSRVASYASHENKMGTLLKSIEKDEATRALAGKTSQMLTHARYNSALDDAVTETRQGCDSIGLICSLICAKMDFTPEMRPKMRPKMHPRQF